ncbi:hypothetical protein HMPREF2734_11145 [Corynebacterium sp. HMSC055D05]|nr:hypothetical protein HMPREF2734_11145 [Corynebacterium sp. HMSC055D05]
MVNLLRIKRSIVMRISPLNPRHFRHRISKMKKVTLTGKSGEKTGMNLVTVLEIGILEVFTLVPLE